MFEGMKRRLFGDKFRVIVATPCGLHYATQTVRAKSEEAAKKMVIQHYKETGHAVKIVRVDAW